MRTEILICGSGGQGIVLAGTILGDALANSGKRVTLTKSYGPEARGGASSAEIIVSDDTIYSIEVSKPNYLIMLSLSALKKFTVKAVEETIVIVDENIAEKDQKHPWGRKIVAFPFTRLAEELGNLIYTNMIFLGFFTAITRILTPESIKKAIRRRVTKGIEKDLIAFEKGYDLAIAFSGSGLAEAKQELSIKAKLGGGK
ncbi:MAG: 2-oxoacid:acceptor oxidoreductase family protein [Candidatus Hodarchaeota archaeon]